MRADKHTGQFDPTKLADAIENELQMYTHIYVAELL